jgi:PAS domain S-box-containing protein
MPGDATGDWLDRLADGVVVFDVTSGEVLRVNRQFCDLVEYDRDELLGRGVDAVSDEAAPYRESTLRERLAGNSPGASRRFEWTVRTQSGRRLPVDLGVAIRDIEGERRAVASVRDVTERVEREQALERYRRRLDGAMFAGDLAWWEMDVETGEVRFHEHKADMLGFPSDRFTHYEDFMELVHPADADRAMEAMRDHFEGRAGKYDVEYRIRDADGEYRWFHDVGGITERGEDGSPEKATGVVVDITARKTAEVQLRRKTDQLAMLNQLIRHDVRNHMSVVTGWLELVREEVSPDLRDRIDRVLDAGEAVVELTHTMEELTAVIVADEGGLDLEPVALDAVLRSEIERVRQSFDAVTVRVDDLPDVRVRANAALSSVFGNLLNNAVQHNDSATPEITVSVEDRGGEVSVAVADNGPGIPADRRDEVLARGEKSPDSDGSGIGLFLVRKLVEAYGGAVRITDNEPDGTVFHVVLEKAT